jgi:hypothetical protein
MPIKSESKGIGQLRYLELCWGGLERLCDAVAYADELGDAELREQCHRLALRLAPRVGASANLVRRMEQNQENARRSRTARR